MKAAQQKNCTKPTFQNVDGAFFRRVIQLAFSSLPSATGLYSLYSFGFHSRTFRVV